LWAGLEGGRVEVGDLEVVQPELLDALVAGQQLLPFTQSPRVEYDKRR
jgi:hypothetical protein